MSSYKLRWVTEQLAVGAAPMSEKDIEVIRESGITGIVNLCAEYCDLVDIERISGFDVFYLPIKDDSIPDLKEMEKALEWLDEAIFLGKKVLVHCRLGLGRTGTFINSYLLRRGFGLKQAQKKLKHIKSEPSSYYQWDLLRKYDKENKRLTIREPSLEGRNLVDLSPYFSDYEVLITEIDRTVRESSVNEHSLNQESMELDNCCRHPFSVQLIEAAYLHHSINKTLSRDDRLRVIEKALEIRRIIQENGDDSYLCPLNEDSKCLILQHRPVRCRIYEFQRITGLYAHKTHRNLREALIFERLNKEAIDMGLHEISRQLFLALNPSFLDDTELRFTMLNVLSGRFVQDYFTYVLKKVKRFGD